VSEAAPGYPDEIAYVNPQRARLAASLRELIEVVMTSAEATDAELAGAADAVEATTAGLAGARNAMTGAGYSSRSHGDYLPRSPVVGAASPIAPGSIEWTITPDPDRPAFKRCIATGNITAAYEGPPGYVHGGIIALIFDEVLGIINISNGCPGMTGSLTVRYRKPTPLYTDLRWVAWIDRVEGRRVQSTAQVWNGDVLCAEADGLFIQPRDEVREAYFGT
jgi:acyl-coenzyme A thioesterase PaaI-like protein